MALKQSDGILIKSGATARSRKLPVLYKADLEEHLRHPEVCARMKHVQSLVRARAQQKS